MNGDIERGDYPVIGHRIETNPATGNPRLTWVDDKELPPNVNLDFPRQARQQDREDLTHESSSRWRAC
jgi:hypothetical protein